MGEHRNVNISAQKKYKLNVLEQTYTIASNHTEAIESKRTAYAPLVDVLQSQGHEISLNIIASDVRVPLTPQDTKALMAMGIPKNRIKEIRCEVWIRAIYYLHKIIVAWRQIEATTNSAQTRKGGHHRAHDRRSGRGAFRPPGPPT